MSEFIVSTNTALCDSVYLNTYTYGRTTDCSNDVSFKTDLTGNEKNVSPTGIILNFVVCGNEQLTLTPLGQTHILNHFLNENPGATKYTYDYTSWYDKGPCSHPACKNKRYYLGGCYNPGYEAIEYND